MYMIESIWGDTELPAYPKLDGDIKTDILIVGGGLAGVLCAHFLHKAGADCTLIEADRLCRGVTRNTTAKITAQHGLIYESLIRRFGAERAKAYYRANEEALAAYRALCERIACDFETRDSFVYATDRRDKINAEFSALRALGIPAEIERRVPLPFPVSGAIRFREQAQFHPLKFVRGLLGGETIYEQTKLLSYDGRAFVTSGGRITAKKAIIATHFPIFNKHGSYFLKMYQHRSYVLALEGAQDVGGMYVDADEKGLSLRNAGDVLLLGGGSHRTGKHGGGWAELEAFAKKHYPDARERARFATQDCMTLDSVPYIGQYSKNTPDLFVATGFNKWGMTSSMVAAQVLSDLVLGQESPYAALFSPSRTILRPQLALNALETTANLLTPTAPRCPHLGCALKWNAAEHSWDCPCHGSRFGEDGTLLDGPATDDLEKK